MTSPWEPEAPQSSNPQSAQPPPPKPWYETPLGLAGIVVGLIALGAGGAWALWASGDGDEVDASASSTTVEETTTSIESTTTTIDEATTTSSEAVGTTTTAAAASTTAATAPASSTTALSVPPTAGSTPWDVIKNSPDLSMFRRAIEDADLIELFQGEAPFTVFAPSNDAFAALRAGVGGPAVLDDPEQLKALVLHHVVLGNLSSGDVFALTELDTESGDQLTVDAAAMTIGGAAIVVADFAAGSSVIHVIDQVLVPGN